MKWEVAEKFEEPRGKRIRKHSSLMTCQHLNEARTNMLQFGYFFNVLILFDLRCLEDNNVLKYRHFQPNN